MTLKTIVLAAVSILAFSAGARADAIDGEWCNRDGKQMSIRGEQITTPDGNRTTGNYQRHNFSYVVPGTEPQAGATAQMSLINENTVHMRVAQAGTCQSRVPVQIWQRCTPVS